jgi:hypothetical protein
MRIEVCADCSYPVREIGRAKVCIRCFVRRTTSAQGLPEKVEDPVVLRDVAVLMGRGMPGA